MVDGTYHEASIDRCPHCLTLYRALPREDAAQSGVEEDLADVPRRGTRRAKDLAERVARHEASGARGRGSRRAVERKAGGGD